MSFYTSLSGLQAAQTDMASISHNLANVSTNGFKKSRTEFADVIASNVALSPTQMIGSGTVVKANRQQFGQGNLIQSSNSLDLAISGDGFFAVKPNVDSAKINFTRNGGFLVDADHFVVDGNGSHLQVYPVDGSGSVVATGLDTTISLRVPSVSGKPVATTAVNMSVNLNSNVPVPDTATFDRFDPTSYNQSTATTIYDANGTALTLNSYFKRDTIGNGTDPSTWSVYSFVGDQQMKSGGEDRIPVTFDATGTIVSPAGLTQFDAFTPAGATTAQSLSYKLNAETTQTASPFTVISRSQDGKAVGQIEGVSVDEAGLVKASFSNGDVQALGKVALANFANPSGLRQLGNSYWSATGVSGEAKVGAAGDSGFGTLMSGTIERSNVDITEELVGLIAAQRNFQANAKALDTASQISQTIFNIRS